MSSKHAAVAAGLALTLTFGALAAPKPAVADDTTPGVASDATDIDKGLYIEQSLVGAMRSVQGINLVNVSDEMKYFTKYESHGNYNQGFSYGDGYNALGYYQFDRRWSLISFMRQVYNYNPVKYGMLKPALDRGSDISNAANSMYANGQLTELGRIAQDAFQGAYAADPVEFSALQDSYAYNSYYAVTESWLKNSLGIDISGRADSVKGMVWSITNMCGTGGCQDFFRWADLSNNMSDREFVTALANSVVDNVARKYPNQTRYHNGWKNRYRNELKDCLVYISEDEEAAAAAKPSEPTGDSGSDVNAGIDSGTGPNASSSNDDAVGGDTVNGGSSLDSPVANGATSGTIGSDSASKGGSSRSDNSNADSGSSSKSDGMASESASNGSDENSDNASGSDSKSTDANGSTSDDAKDTERPDQKDSPEQADADSKDSSKDTGKDGKTNAEKFGEAVGDALTSGLSKGENKSKFSDSKDVDASEEQKSSTDGDSKKDGDSKEEDDSKASEKVDDKKQTEQKKDGGASGVSSNASASNNKNATNGSMPRTGDLVIMASLASASLATFGMTAIVSGKNKLKDRDEADNDESGRA